jgi:hypothetical protein
MKTIRMSTMTLLLLNGMAAIAGGTLLVADPSGSVLGMPLLLLDGTPFSNYFIPGLILILTIGVASLSAAAAVGLRLRHGSALTILEGVLLSGWIIIQVVMIGQFNVLQVIFGGIGFVIFGLGMIMADNEFSFRDRYSA